MAYLGLVPSEHSSGGTRRQGGITKAGNGAARRMLIEVAGATGVRFTVSRKQLLGQEALANHDPRHCLESARTVMPAVPQACPGGEAADRGRHRVRARAGGLQGASSRRSQKQEHSTGALISTEVFAEHPRLRNITNPQGTHPKLGKAGGTVTARRTLVSTTSRIIRRWLLDRGSSATHHRSGGHQSAHQSMINRRLDDRASNLAQ